MQGGLDIFVNRYAIRTLYKMEKGLQDNCTVYTQFYPDGYENYLYYCFLVDTDHKESVIELFSLFPTTPFVMKVSDQFLIFTTYPLLGYVNLILIGLTAPPF